jgi:hypothetical protein
MIREAAYAGQFYPASPAQLRKMIQGMVHDDADKEDVVAAVIPHAGYIYSGRVVGAVLSRVKMKETAVVLCPNHTGRGKPFALVSEGSWRTPLGEIRIDSNLAGSILAGSHYLEEDHVAHSLEHAIEVQLPFLQYFKPDIKLVPVVLGHGNGPTYKEIGLAIATAIRNLKTDTLVIASSDMTHYESQESVETKDRQAISAMLDLDEDELLRRVERLDITMCGYGPAAAVICAARDLGASRAELVRYQTSGDGTGDYSSVVGYAGITMLRMSPLAKLARAAVEDYVRERHVPKVWDAIPEMNERAGVFVSIHKKGALRGCIGTFEPAQPDVAREIMANAVSSATHDPRFSPVRAEELKDLEYSVDVLTEPAVVEGREQLDPKKYGVIVESGWRRGLLLPDLEGVETVEQQIDISCQKAGISRGEPIKLYRFEVKRYK